MCFQYFITKKGIEELRNAFNNVTSAMVDLQNSAIVAGVGVRRLKKSIRNKNPQIFRVFFRKIDIMEDLKVRVLERAEICHTCELNNTFCEGSLCDTTFDNWWDSLEKVERRALLFEYFGSQYYNFSIRLKNKLVS